ncbi:MAG: AMP-binding protein, partial [Algicola sp.]|nr:AMP-binding protein [Algicola sp.]
GMSETCSGISWSLDFCADGGEINNVVSLGPPIPGAAFRIVDERGEVLPQGSIGHFEIKGASLFSGYYQRDDLNREVFGDDGWFNTGDMGFVDNGQLYLTGRNKDDIIINGVNFFSHEIEQALEELPEVEVSFAAASAVKTGSDDREKLALFINPAHGVATAVLQRKVQAHLLDKLGLVADFVLALDKADFPKTGIGKIQKAQLRARFEKGDYIERLTAQGHTVNFENIIEQQYFSPSWMPRALVQTQQNSPVSKRIFVVHFGDNILLGERFEQVELIHCVAGNTFETRADNTIALDFAQEQQWRRLFQNSVNREGKNSSTTEIAINVDGINNEQLQAFFTTLKSSVKLIKNQIQALRFIGYADNMPSLLLSNKWLEQQQIFVAKGVVQLVQIESPLQYFDVNLGAEFAAKVDAGYVIYTNNSRLVLSLQAHSHKAATPLFCNKEYNETQTVVLCGCETGLINAFGAYLIEHFDIKPIYCGPDDTLPQSTSTLCFNIQGNTAKSGSCCPATGQFNKVVEVYSVDHLAQMLPISVDDQQSQLFLDSAFNDDSRNTDIAQLLYFLEQNGLEQNTPQLACTSLANACRLGVTAYQPQSTASLKSYLTGEPTQQVEALSIDTEVVEQLPLDYKGQVDRKSLGRGRLSNQSTALRASAVAKQVEKVWKTVLNLNVSQVPHDETFFELGGHSLLIAKTQGLLEQALDRKISVLELFKFPTIGEFSKYIQDASELVSTSHGYGLSRALVRNKLRGTYNDSKATDIAIVGMACRFPGANTVEDFWQNLSQGKESISFFTAKEAKAAGVHADWYDDDQYVFAAPVIDDVDQFDAGFFAITPRDADLRDPQQRVAIEVAWETLERAGYNPKTYDGS